MPYFRDICDRNLWDTGYLVKKLQGYGILRRPLPPDNYFVDEEDEALRVYLFLHSDVKNLCNFGTTFEAEFSCLQGSL